MITKTMVFIIIIFLGVKIINIWPVFWKFRINKLLKIFKKTAKNNGDYFFNVFNFSL